MNSLKRRSDLWLQMAASVNTGILRVKKEGQRMLEKTNLLGAIVAHVIYISSILTFISRFLDRTQLGQQFGYPLLLMAFPLGYLLWKAPQLEQPMLYYIQIGLMLVWILREVRLG